MVSDACPLVVVVCWLEAPRLRNTPVGYEPKALPEKLVELGSDRGKESQAHSDEHRLLGDTHPPNKNFHRATPCSIEGSNLFSSSNLINYEDMHLRMNDRGKAVTEKATEVVLFDLQLIVTACRLYNKMN